jgi:hypothetical protein
MIEDIRCGVSGGTPGANSNDYVLFDSTIAFNSAGLATYGIDRAQFTVDNSAAGTLKSYFSPDKGTTWKLNASTSVAANGGGATSGILASPFDYEINGFGDWKLVWTNGGSAQTSWLPILSLTRGQKASGV